VQRDRPVVVARVERQPALLSRASATTPGRFIARASESVRAAVACASAVRRSAASTAASAGNAAATR